MNCAGIEYEPEPDPRPSLARSFDIKEIAIEPRISALAHKVRKSGGRAVIVGGWVRDHLLGIRSKDIDIEVFGLGPGAFESLLGEFGRVDRVGSAFAVYRVAGIDADFSLPRSERKSGRGHRGFEIEADPSLDFARASRRRDFTVNSIGLDPLTGELLDPHRGVDDLRAQVLRATDPERFAEDPLRGLRMVGFAARLAMRPDDALIALCRGLDIASLSGERIFDEFKKLLLRSRRPSLGLQLLETTGMLAFFPELEALRRVPQDPKWHPEGDVWVHTLMAVDAAAGLLRQGKSDPDLADPDALTLMFATLCHDFGKPATTVCIDGHIRSPDHAPQGVAPAREFLTRMRAPKWLIERIEVLVEHHLAPMLYIRNGAQAAAYRRLSRRLMPKGVSLELLERLARADHWGRTTAEAKAGEFEAGDIFLERARRYGVERSAVVDAVQGRHLIRRGLVPGPEFATILARCREIQDDSGWSDPDRILDRMEAERQSQSERQSACDHRSGIESGKSKA
ncbi:MAG: polynucleotide adenylyltransferase [Ectothiorhodospiraceae bacterium AqS1]|nr:polynucleotide adenylyltransferase [Ectothiorhodospiraceae bacterium AqS1]